MNEENGIAPKQEFIVGPPNMRDKSLVEFKRRGHVLHSARFDPFDQFTADKSIQTYLQIAGTGQGEIEKETRLIRSEIQKQASAVDTSLVPNLKSASDVIGNPPPMKQQVIEGMLRVGETCNFIAASKVGKSWLTLGAAFSVVTGEPMLGTFPTVQGNVLLLDNELDRETLENRINEVAKALNLSKQAIADRFKYECFRGRNVDIYSLESYFAAIQPNQFSLVILDALYRFMPPNFSENDNSAMTSIYNRLDQYAKRLNAAIILIHHSSKGDQGGKRNTDVGSGAGAMSRAADSHLAIREHEEEGLHVLTASVRSFPPVDPQTIRFNWPRWFADATEPVLGVAKPRPTHHDRTREKNLAKVVEAYRGRERFTAGDVRTLIGGRNEKAINVIVLGEDKGSIEQAGMTKPPRSSYEVMSYRVTCTV